MNRNVHRNRTAFLGAAAVIVAVVFGVSAAPHAARAYAIESGSGTDTTAPMGTSSYDFGSSFQNLVTPFQNFWNTLTWNNGTTVNTQGQSSFIPPNLNAGPALENLIKQWLTEFDNWFYKLTGVRLSGIVYVILNAISWALHLAEVAVNWLIGLFP